MVVWIEITAYREQMALQCVTTCVVVWIEILHVFQATLWHAVTTCVVVWIEICAYQRLVP